ncbi:MAG: nitroreductase family protein [Euryarchaeota archaeon]|nr:nitroreductase family protein [Euryarchaeota archaeon]MBU4607723.1 nitroreductase family protein [Euryarchaeota archaeon]MBV1755915.1 nitroreductase family protein [Methanobacterium sp.]
MRNHRSIRNYKNKLVSPDIIEEVVDIVRYAPTGMNTQPVKWVILESPEKVKELSRICIDWMKKEVESDSPYPNIYPWSP